MSTIVFLRHAQASLFSENYDQLSELGQQQANELGRYLAGKELTFDEVYTGPRQRHRHTLTLAAEHTTQLPAMTEIPELDEHHVDQLVTDHLEPVMDQFPHVRALRDAFRTATDFPDRQKRFAVLFEAVALLWMTETCPLSGVESWAQFSRRVNSGIDRMLQQSGRGRNILVCTSAGAIVAALHRALRCPEEIALGLGWRIWNCSITGFAYSGNRFSLDRFNSMAHLENPDHWTYR